MADVIRIGAFFDGTGNNVWNDELIGDGSQTNVAKLYRMYQNKSNEGYKAFYEEGAGTEAYTQTHTFRDEIDPNTGLTKLATIQNQDVYKDRKDYYAVGGLAFGVGVKHHAENMLTKITDAIEKAKQANPNAQIIVDVYGFSRGATSARDFINMFNEKYANLNGSAIGFVGLFDTVATVGLANEYNADLNLNLNTYSAQQMVHLTANDERRANFPLNLMGNNGSNMKEIGMLGAHADIGGGYGNSIWDTEEKLIVERFDEAFTPIAITETAIQARDERIAQLEAQATSKGYEFIVNTYTDQHTGELGFRAVFVQTRDVGVGLSNNALSTMLGYMNQSGINIPNNISKVPSSASYVHTSSSDNWLSQTFEDWIAYRQEWSIDDKRDSYANYPNNAQDKLVKLSAEDKTLLHFNNSPYNILATQSELNALAEQIDLHGASFSTHRLEYLNQYFTNTGSQYPFNTIYHDTATDLAFHGQDISGVSLVDFATQTNDVLVYTANNNAQIVYAKGGDDTIEAGAGNDTLYGGEGNDELFGCNDTDTLNGGADNDNLYGGDDNATDILIGGSGVDTLIGGAGDDILTGGYSLGDPFSEKETDYLTGGTGDDTYAVSHNDVIYDEDGLGNVTFNGVTLSGTKTKVEENTYEDENFTYTQTEGDLYVVDKNLGEYITITSFKNKDLGIELQNNLTKVSLETTHTFKDDEYVYVRVLLDQSLQESSEVILNIFGSTYTTTIEAGDVDSVAAIRLNESWGSALEIKITDTSESLEFEEERVYEVDVLSSNEREEDKYSLYMHDISDVEDELKSFLLGGDQDWEGYRTRVQEAKKQLYDIVGKQGYGDIVGTEEFVAIVASVCGHIYYNTPMSDEFKQALRGLSLNYSYESARAELWLAMRDTPKYSGLTTNRLQDALGLYNTEEKTKPSNVYEALQVIKTFKEDENSYGLFSKLGSADELVEEQYGLSIGKFSDIEILSIGTFADWYAFNNGDLDYKFVGNQGGYNAEMPTDAKYVIGHNSNDIIGSNRDQKFILNSVSGVTLYAIGGTNTIYVNYYDSDDMNNFINMIRLDEVESSERLSNIYGGSGNDTVYGGVFNDEIKGNDGSDVLYGYTGNDSIWGGAGADEIYGGLGYDILDGGAGDDIIYGDEDEEKPYLEEYKSMMSVHATYGNKISGGEGNDTIYGDKGDDIIHGDEGNDTIYGGLGGDVIDGGEGNDTIYGEDNKEENEEENGEENVNDRIYGGEGNDTIFGGKGDDVIHGDEGNDTIYGGEGIDTIDGGVGNDTIYGDAIPDEESKDERIAADAPEVIHGGDGDDVIFGGNAQSELSGDAGDDIIYGGNHDDILSGGTGRNYLVGGEGYDTYYATDQDVIGIPMDVAEGDTYGVVYFEGFQLSGGAYDEETRKVFGDGGEYTYDGVNLSFIKEDGTSLTIQNFLNGNLGIKIDGAEKIGLLDNELMDFLGEDGEYLHGGNGYDTYHASGGDVIMDSDGEGRVLFNGMLLGSNIRQVSSNQYKDDYGFTYTLDGTTLNVSIVAQVLFQPHVAHGTSHGGNAVQLHYEIYRPVTQTIKILNFADEDLGIYLTNPRDTTQEGDFDELDLRDDFSSPLVFDLDANNTISQNFAEGDVYFDFNGDGFAERAGWIDPNDGFLVYDKDENGSIDDGSELFGDNVQIADNSKAKDGFSALAQYDINKDSVINKYDAIFSSLQVWQDKNSNGVSEIGELFTLKELGITSIDINATQIEQSENANVITHTATFEHNGETKNIQDVWFKTLYSDTILKDTLTLSDDVLSLPDIKGSGVVMDLSQALMRDEALLSQYNEYLGGLENIYYTNLYSQTKELLINWTGVSNIDPQSTRGVQYVLNHQYADPQKSRINRIFAYERDVALVEVFDGKEFSMVFFGSKTDEVIGTIAANALEERVEFIVNSAMVQVLSQKIFHEGTLTDPQTIADKVINQLPQMDDATLNLSALLVSALYKMGNHDILNNVSSDITKLTNLLTLNGIVLAEDENGYQYVNTATLNATYSSDYLVGDASNNTIDGKGGSDILIGKEGDDTLKGGSGYGHGQDVLIGGRGNDLLIGNRDSTTYIYRYGDGNDIIEDKYDAGNSKDTLVFENMLYEDVEFIQQNNDILIKIKSLTSDGYSGTILLQDALEQTSSVIELFTFEDKTLHVADLQLIESEKLHYEKDEKVKYLDCMFNTLGYTFTFGEGISKDDLAVKAYGDDLIVALQEDGVLFDALEHKVVLQNWFDDTNKMQSFLFADNTTLSKIEILDKQMLTNGDDYVRYSSADDVINGLEGDDILLGGRGDDTYFFGYGSGHDTIVDQKGVDTVLFSDDVMFDDIIIKQDPENQSVQIGLKEDGKSFEELANTITIFDWENNNIEFFKLQDKKYQIINGQLSSNLLILGTSSDDVISNIQADATIKTFEGDDLVDLGDVDANFHIFVGNSGKETIHLGDGNNTIEGDSWLANASITLGNGDNSLNLHGRLTDFYEENHFYGDDFAVGEQSRGHFVMDTLEINNGSGTLNLNADMFEEVSIFSEGILDLNITDTMNTYIETTTQQNSKISIQKNQQADVGESIIDLLDGNDSVTLIDVEELQVALGGGNNRIEASGFDSADISAGSEDDVYIFYGDSDFNSVSIEDAGGSSILEVHNVESFSFYRDIQGTALQEDVMATFKNQDDSSVEFTGVSAKVQLGVGNDTFRGSEGSFTINTTKGDDSIFTDVGDDTFIFNEGDGVDTITDTGGFDRIKINKAFEQNSFKVTKSNADLIISYSSNDTDKIIIKNYDASGTIEEISFSDGTIITKNDIDNFLLTNELLYDTNYPSQDLSQGMKVEFFRFGYGNGDVLINSSANQVLFDFDINKEDISFQKQEGTDNLIIYLKNKDAVSDEIYSDSLTLEHWYSNTNHVNAFCIQDGIFNRENIIDLMATNEDDIIYGTNETSVYDYRIGNGVDTIVDGGGVDTLQLLDILPEMVHITWIQGTDSIEVTFDGYTDDKVIIQDWYKNQNHIEFFEFSDGTIWNTEQILDAMGTDGDDAYKGFENKDNTIVSGMGDDIVIGYDGDDLFYGGEGDDSINGGSGNDTLVGQEGSDFLMGGAGNDTYVFNRGDGSDTIYDNGIDLQGGMDTIIFGQGIHAEELFFSIDEETNNLYINIGSAQSDDQITITDWYINEHCIEFFKFESYSDVLHTQDILDKIKNSGSPIKASSQGGLLEGSQNNDTLIGSSANDILMGHDGDDILLGKDGDDLLSGGKGRDRLEGGAGDDRYEFNVGDGFVTIFDEKYEVSSQRSFKVDENGSYAWVQEESKILLDAGNDRVVFGEGIILDNIIARMDGKNLILAINDENANSFDELQNRLFIENFDSEFNRIEFFEFKDGTIVNSLDILKNAFSEFDDYVVLNTTQNQSLFGDAGDDYITAGDGNDTLEGGLGNDELYGGYGDDVYLFNIGDGQDIISDKLGYDTIVFGANIDADKLKISQRDNNLVIEFEYDSDLSQDKRDRITILNWDNEDQQIENFEFHDTSALNAQDLVETNIQKEESNSNQNSSFQEEQEDDATEQKNDTIEQEDVSSLPDTDSLEELSISKIENELQIVIAQNINRFENFFKTTGDPLTLAFQDRNITINREAIIDKDNLLIGQDGLNSLFVGNNGYSHFVGKNADETFFGFGSNNIFHAGLGDDLLITKEGLNVLYGQDGSDTLISGEFGDILYGGNESDTIFGQNGNDKLYGQKDNDILDGGKGDDKLSGGEGDDIYYFNVDDGNDIIYETLNNNSNDIIHFKEGIAKEDVVFYQDDKKQMHFQYSDNGEITVFNHGVDGMGIEHIETADGYYLDCTTMEMIVQSIHTFKEQNDIQIDDFSKIKQNEQLMQFIASSWQQA